MPLGIQKARTNDTNGLGNLIFQFFVRDLVCTFARRNHRCTPTVVQEIARVFERSQDAAAACLGWIVKGNKKDVFQVIDSILLCLSYQQNGFQCYHKALFYNDLIDGAAS